MAGFGHGPFGHTPFGHSDYGAETVTRIFPQTSLEKDTSGKMQNFLVTIANSVNQRRTVVDDMIDLVDPDRIRADLLINLGNMIGLDLDNNEPEEFQRTLVRDAVQFFQVKGTDASFKIRGKISGFDVEVIKIWNFDSIYLPYIPADNQLEFPPGSGTVSGIWYTDLAPDEVPGVSGLVPITGDCTYCLTSYIKVSYTLVKTPDDFVVGNLLDRVIQKVRDVVPIHVRDVFIDLTIIIEADINPGVIIYIDEESFIPICVVDRYDFIPADYVRTDFHIPAVVNGNA